jgi:hypothetical protein
MNCPACSAPVEAGATWCPTCGGVLLVDRAAVPRAVDPALSAANKALAFSLPAPCCAPLAVVGLFYAIRAIKRSRQQERTVPKRALVALMLAALSLLFWIWFVVSFSSYQRELEQKRQAVQQRLAGKREAATIDQRVACDLVEEQLRAGLYEGWGADEVTCRGPFESGPDRALLKGVEMVSGITRIRLNACLARTQRWFVLRVTAGERCPAPPRPIPGAAAEAEEDVLRRQASEQGDDEDVAAFLATLAQVRDVVAPSARSKRFCPPIDVASFSSSKHPDHLRLRTVDLQRLQAHGGMPPPSEWGFLTSNEVGTALDVRIPIRQRAAAVHRIGLDGGPYLVVFQSVTREWPVVVEEETDEVTSVGSGRWAGWMVVVDTRAAQPVCETWLSAESSSRHRERSLKKRAAAAAKELREQFEEEATARMKTMSGRVFRLGYKLLE